MRLGPVPPSLRRRRPGLCVGVPTTWRRSAS
jgi:hypothetical protein